MTTQAIKFFFMASISVIHEGKLVTRFNTISAVNSINITASVLDMIQQGAASMVQDQGNVAFTDLVIENVFCLTPLGCTEEEFTKGTQLADQLAGAQAEASDLMADADASAQAEEALSAQVDESVNSAVNSLQDAANEAVAADHAAAQDDGLDDAARATIAEAEAVDQQRQAVIDAAAAEEANITQNSDLSELDAQAVEATPVDDVTTADVKPNE